MSRIVAPEEFRKVAEQLYRQATKDAQISFTEGYSYALYCCINEHRRKNADWEWPTWNKDEKSMLCLFFAEYLEGEK